MFKRIRTRSSPPPRESADVKAAIRLAYTAVLRREPGAIGYNTYAPALQDGRDLAWLIATLAASDEFRAQARAADVTPLSSPPEIEPAHLLSHEPPMRVDSRSSAAELQQLWDHVGRTWSQLGNEEPHWSVLTEDRFRAAALDERQLTAFYGSGDGEVERLNHWTRRGGLTTRPGATCAEFGCGAGRITRSLARQFARVLAFDVSGPHLRTAQARMEAEGIGNVEFVHVTGKQSLAALRDIDVFYSIIALQHSPPPIILDVLAHAFAALRPGGYAFFQLPTYAKGYSYTVSEHINQLDQGINAQGGDTAEMDVHFVPQNAVFGLAHEVGLRIVEVLPDISIGNLDRWISSAFLLTR